VTIGYVLNIAIRDTLNKAGKKGLPTITILKVREAQQGVLSPGFTLEI
jgi:hypothetical protein